MLDKLLNSKNRTKILSFFFQNEEKGFYVQEIINGAKTDAANTHRELLKLNKLEILKAKKEGGRKYYYLNKDLEYFAGLKELFKTYNKSHCREEWFVLEEIPDYYPMLTANAWNTKNANKVFEMLKLKNKFSQLLTIFENNTCTLLCSKKEFNDIAKELVEKIVDDPMIGERYFEILNPRIDKLIKATEELREKNLKNLSKKELYQTYEDYYFNVYEKLHQLHWIQTILDAGENYFSRYLMDYLKDKIAKISDSSNHKYSVGEVFANLTTPIKESSPVSEYRALLKILDFINKKPDLIKYFQENDTRIITEGLTKINTKLNDDLDDHVKKYGWIGYGTRGPGWGKDYFIDILSSLVRQRSTPEELLKKIEEDRKNLLTKREELTNKLNIDEKYQQIFSIARDIVFTKGTRKDSMFFSYSIVENLFKEIGRRYFLSLIQVRYMYPHEFKKLLLENNFEVSKLNARYKFHTYYSKGEYRDDEIIEGEKGSEFLKNFYIIREDIKNVKVLNGDCASPGRVKGIAKNVNVVKDIEKMSEGNILISVATNPELVPAIKKAAAIVTDIGGITCHAAIISRELGIPCVVGTKIATKVLKDGYVIDVDATHGKVNIISKKKK